MEKLTIALRENYNINIKEVTRIEYGLWEENFKVLADNKTYFVKRFWRKSRLLDRYNQMIEGISLGQKLRKYGIPAPLHIMDKEGNLLSPHKDDTYQVNEWVDGITYRPGIVPDEVAYSMGELLGELHIKMNNSYSKQDVLNIQIVSAIEKKQDLLRQYENEDFDGKNEIIQTLSAQILLLKNIDEKDLKSSVISYAGKVYNSYWIEQLLFDETHNVVGLIDWTDGAGGQGNLIDDIDTAIFVSAFELNGITNFIKGYHSIFPLSLSEWEDIIEYTCLRHLDTNWIYTSWFGKTSNRYEHWKTIARKWILGIEYRANNMALIKENVLGELFCPKKCNV